MIQIELAIAFIADFNYLWNIFFNYFKVEDFKHTFISILPHFSFTECNAFSTTLFYLAIKIYNLGYFYGVLLLWNFLMKFGLASKITTLSSKLKIATPTSE